MKEPIVRKMTEEDKKRMEMHAEKARKDRENSIMMSAINRRACARRNYQKGDLI